MSDRRWPLVKCSAAALASFGCFHASAAAPDYGVVTGLFYIAGIGALLAWIGGLLLFAAIGRLFGTWGPVIAAVAYVGASSLALMRYITFMEEERARTSARVATARLYKGEACWAKTGETGTPLASPVNQVFVRLDRRLGSNSGSFLRLRREIAFPNVEYVEEFPSPRPEKSAFVDIRLVRDPIPSAEGWELRGFRSTVTASDGSTIGTRFDIERNRHWCLDDSPELATERFIHRLVGLPVGLTEDPGPTGRGVPTGSLLGKVEQMTEGKYGAHQIDGRLSLQPRIRRILVENGCPPVPLEMDSSGVAICGKGTAHQNSLRWYEILGATTVADGWFQLSAPSIDTYSIDLVDVTKRDQKGAVVGRWRVRFYPIDTRRPGDGRISGSIQIDGETARIELFLAPHFERVSTTDSRTVVWFSERVVITAPLAVE